MKIIIEETVPDMMNRKLRRFSVEVNDDMLNIHEMGKLISQCLEGMTWHPETIREILNYDEK